MDNMTKEECHLFPMWLPCATACCDGDTSSGYSSADGPLGYCVNGQLMVATSLTDEKNCTDPFTGANNTTPPTWTLQSVGSWISSSSVETVTNIFGDIFDTAANGAVTLNCAKLITKCGLATQAQIDALTEEVNSINQGITNGDIFNTTAASSWWTNLFNTTATQTWFNNTLISSVATAFSDTFEVVGGKISINCAKLIEKCSLITSGVLSTNDFTIDPDTGVVTINSESACDATVLTQAQVDAATAVKILACLNDGTVGAITADMIGGSGEVVLTGGTSRCVTLPKGNYSFVLDAPAVLANTNGGADYENYIENIYVDPSRDYLLTGAVSWATPSGSGSGVVCVYSSHSATMIIEVIKH